MRIRRSVISTCTAITLGLALATGAAADEHAEKSMESRDLTDRSSDAWREGKLDTLYLFNRQLNNFNINPEIRGSKVTLTGKVESEVDSELAEEIARGMDGIDTVDNQLSVVPEDQARDGLDERDREFSEQVEDATLTAEVKMKLLANSEVGGLGIDVDTRARHVTLSGEVESSAEKDLAAQIAKNVDGVSEVENNLSVN